MAGSGHFTLHENYNIPSYCISMFNSNLLMYNVKNGHIDSLQATAVVEITYILIPGLRLLRLSLPLFEISVLLCGPDNPLSVY